MVLRKCVTCGKEFMARANTKTCSKECSRLRKNKLNYQYQMGCAVYKARKHQKAKEKPTLDRDIAKAKELGISYGEYKARQFLFKEMAERKANEDL